MKFKKERKVLLIIVISAAMAVISMFMTDNSDKLFCSIERPEPGEETQVKRINVVGEDGESITSVDVEIAPRIVFRDGRCYETVGKGTSKSRKNQGDNIGYTGL